MPDRLTTYEQAIDFLFGRINYERINTESYSTSDFKLDRMRRLLELMGNPHERIPVVHVAGTKGKGSTCSMLSSILSRSGYRCGLYISPHITEFEERITIGGIQPTKPELVSLLNGLMPIIAEMDNLPGRMQPTYFELATALAWQHFIEQNVDIAVLEVGLGGRLDSTNLCRPLVTVITNISRDHTHVLGSTVHQIAYEKAGIIKPQVPVISGVTHVDALNLIENICSERNAPLKQVHRDFQMLNRQTDEEGNVEIEAKTSTTLWSQVPVVLRGLHQASNTMLTLAVIEELRQQKWKITDDDVREGLRSVAWPARVEVVSKHPTVIIDAAHNWESARALVASLNEDRIRQRRILVFAATKDKDVAGILRQLLPNFDTVILTRYLNNPRGVDLDDLGSLVESISGRQTHFAASPSSAWNLAKRIASCDDMIVITGSFFLAAELRDTIISEANQASAAAGSRVVGIRSSTS